MMMSTMSDPEASANYDGIFAPLMQNPRLTVPWVNSTITPPGGVMVSVVIYIEW